MRKSTIEAIFDSDIKQVWDIVTNNEDYHWRSDLAKIEIVNEEEFIEYTKEGFQTKFKITKKERYKLYEFDMENKNFTGHWIGRFEKLENEKTKIIFTEEITIKNKVMEVLSYIFMNIRKIQEQYILDLRKKLDE